MGASRGTSTCAASLEDAGLDSWRLTTRPSGVLLHLNQSGAEGSRTPDL